MIRTNIKRSADARGFTIVELLIVIVVIAILAAITIVAYNGIQNRSKTTAGQSLTGQIAKKAEAWNTIESSYPTFCQLATNTVAPTGTAPSCTAGGAAGPNESELDSAASAITTAVNATTADGGKVISYQTCATPTGFRTGYWDYSAATPAIVWQYYGGASGSSTCS